MRWLELTVEADAEAVEAVSEILGRVGAGTAVRPTRLVQAPDDELEVREDPTSPYVVTAHIPEDSAARVSVERTERALWHLQAFGLGPVGELRVRTVEDDWTDAWKRHYAPQRIGRLMVVPSWLQAPLHDGEVALRLDPGMAFGTGLHPTTRGCLQLLQGLEPMPPGVLDVGSGSGILALAALRLGAGVAVCYDTDELAVAATRANAAVNGLGDRLEARHATLPEVAAATFGLVLANLVATLLVELAPRLTAHTAPGGALVAGGILANRADEVGGALRAAGLREVERLTDGEWVSVRLERPA